MGECVMGRALGWGMLRECVVNSREMRSKHFLSSRLGLTWQVRRFSLAGDLLGWNEGIAHH